MSNAISSFVGSLSFYPSVMNCSGSILFKICGGDSRMHSILGGIAIFGLIPIFHKIIGIFPTFVITLIPEFIGLSFLIEYLISFFKITNADKINVLICLFVSIVFDIFWKKFLKLVLVR